MTVEIEHVGVETLEELEREGVNVQPSGRVLSIIRDKFLQKEHFDSHKIPLPPFRKTPSVTAIKQAAHDLGLLTEEQFEKWVRPENMIGGMKKKRK